MSAFEKTKWRLRISLIDNNDKIIDSYETPGMDWLKLRPIFERHKRENEAAARK